MKRFLICVTAWMILFSHLGALRASEPKAGAAVAGPSVVERPATPPRQFTPLVPLETPAIIQAAEAYPGGAYEAENMIDGVADGRRRSEYASASKGTDTFIDFDFGKPTPIAAFKHVDRFDPATVAAADLVFSDDADFKTVVATVKVKHANARGGVTLAPFTPVTARYVRWQVTAVHSYGTVGGAEIGFFSAAQPEPAPTRTVVESTRLPAVVEEGGKRVRPFQVTVRYPYAEPVEATLEVSGVPPTTLRLSPESQTVELLLPAGEGETEVTTALKIAGETVAESREALKPVRPWSLYILPHSHVDIGYTHVQTEVEQKQWAYLEQAIELARGTVDYPPEARFKWNSEGLWAVDSYLKQAPPEKRRELIEAVRKGWIELDALYGNELTGLCRPEELFRLVDCARRLSKEHDLVIDSAMISDVPGYTWGIVPALAHSGVKYFSIGPNHVHRIGYTLADWGDRAFWWKSPSGEHRVLCWMAGKAYSWFHNGRLGEIKGVEPRAIFEYLSELDASGYPYDMVQVRYSIGGDNGPPDPNLPEFVKAWNAKYAYPKMVISTTGELFGEFERRYGDRVPEVRGDFTPYWEDGAGSSAKETAIARNTSERLVQAEALWALLNPREYPSGDFCAAWRNVLLYNEHTWGAHCSISQPDSQFTLDQWKIKQTFALEGRDHTRKLVTAAVAGHKRVAREVRAIDVFNTASWPRSDLLILPPGLPLAGGSVKSTDGAPVPSQRLSTGELAVLAVDVPPLGAKRLLFGEGDPEPTGTAKAEGATLACARIRLEVDEATGAIGSLAAEGLPDDLVRADAGLGLNQFVYVPGRDPKDAVRSGPAKITVKEPGPLVASLWIECDAPGCRKLSRELRVVDGLDRVDLVNVVDKEDIRTKESVHFGFAFNVPGGVMRMDVPWAVVRPEADQLPGACKNYFTVGRWVDVSNDDYGVTWATEDAPLVEVGAITVDVLPDPFHADNWIRRLEPTQTFYSYVMNNYWETNYKASQGGTVVFRYSIMPHGKFDPAAAARFGIGQTQPLVVVPVDPSVPIPQSLFRVEPASVIVSSLKPSEDRKAWMVRLFNTADTEARATISWNPPAPKRVSISSPSEEPGPELADPIDLPGYGIVTLRAELPD
ncbi:MAG TPA: discoidin domain-containing protein [Thermoguttaceae bacterium]|nr:discoidin domain-containing protein [Thermoguttaceae bacterium]